MQFSSHKSPIFLLSLIYSKTHLVSMTLYSNFPPAVSPVVNFLINSYLEGWPFASCYIFHAPMNNKVIQCVLTVGLYMHLCWDFQELCLWRISPYPEKKPTAQQGLGSISHSGTVWITLVALSGKMARDTCSLLTSHITYTWRSQNHRITELL